MNRRNNDRRVYRSNDSYHKNKRNENRYKPNRRNDNNYNNYQNNKNYHSENDRNNYNFRRGYKEWNRDDEDYYYNNGNGRNNFPKKGGSFYNSRHNRMNRTGSVPHIVQKNDWSNNDDDQSEDSYKDSSNDRNNFHRKPGFSFRNRSVNTQRFRSVPPTVRYNYSDGKNNGDNQSVDSYNQNTNNISKKRKKNKRAVNYENEDFRPQSKSNKSKRAESDENEDFRPQSKSNKRVRIDDKKQNAANFDDETDCGAWDPWCDVKENGENSDKESNELNPASDVDPEQTEEVQVESQIDKTNSNCEETSIFKDLKSHALMKVKVFHCAACHCIIINLEDAMKHVKTEYHKLALKNFIKKYTGIDIGTNQDLAQAYKNNMVNFDENLNLPGSSLKARNDCRNLLADSFKNLPKS